MESAHPPGEVTNISDRVPQTEVFARATPSAGIALDTFAGRVGQRREQACEQADAYLLDSAVLVVDACLTDMGVLLSDKLGPAIAAKALNRVLGDHAYKHLVRLMHTNHPSMKWPATAEAASAETKFADLP